MKRERTPVRLFVIAAAADAAFQTELEKHGYPLWQQGLLENWQSVQPGEQVEEVLAQAKLILLLLSADFHADAWCQEHMQRALEWQKEGEVKVLPILVRPVEGTNAPFAHLAMVPTNGQAVTLWANQDAAWTHITEAIRCVLEGKLLPQVGAVKQAGSAPGAEKRVWMVPYPRNPFFTGRAELLAQLAVMLHTGQPAALSQPQAISGLGGIGKTQIAVEYAYRSVQNYQAVLWVQADTRENVTSSYVVLAGVLNLPEKEAAESAQVVAAVKRWLEQETGYLLIVDNADDLVLACDFLPVKPSGHILVTTRAQVTGRFARKLEVETLPTEQGILFLLRRAGLLAVDAPVEQAKEAERMIAKRVCEELGGLPLALDQAGAYIEETGCSLVRYEQRYRLQRGKVLAERRGELVNDHPLPVATTWKLSFEQVEQRSPVAADVLRVCAFLAPDAIPETIFTQGAAQLGPELAAVEKDADVFDQAVEVLRAYSLLRRESRAGPTSLLSVHRLVQAVLKDHMGDQEQQQWGERMVRAVAAVLPPVQHETWEQWEQILAQAVCCSEVIEQDHLRFAEATLLLQQTGWYLTERVRYREAEGLLRQGFAITEQEQGLEHLDIARDGITLGYLYRAQGRYGEAEPLYQRALEIHERELGPGHPETATSLNNLAALYYAQGKYAEAEPLLRRALEICEQELGPRHPDTALSLNNLALLYDVQGKYAEAEPLYERGLEICEQSLGPGHPDTALSLNNLAALYNAQGRYGEAEPLVKRGLEICEQELGPGHPDTALSLNNLAALYDTQGKYGEAEPLYQRALEICEQSLGPGHPDTALSLNNLAALYDAQGKYGEAELLHERALAIYEQTLGPGHPDTALSLNNLAALYDAQGKYAEAEPLYERALAIYEQALGPGHPATALSLNNLAALYDAQGKYGEAEPLMKRALEIREQELGLGHPDTAGSLNNLAELYNAQGRYGEAELLYERALEIYEQTLGPGHPNTAMSLDNLAGLYQVQGKYTEAELLCRRALEIREQSLGPRHPDMALSLNNLAGLYQDQGKYAEAEPLMKRGLEIREQELGPGHPSTVTSVNNLAALYYTQGKYSEAEPLYQRALEIREQELGLGHPDTARSLNNLAVLYHAQGKYAEAEPLYQRALEIRERELGPGHRYTAASLNNLALLYKAQGKYGEAEPLFLRAVTILQQSVGAGCPNTKQVRKIYVGLLRELGREEEAAVLEAEGH